MIFARKPVPRRTTHRSLLRISLALTLVCCAAVAPAQAHRFLLEETSIDGAQRAQYEQTQKEYCAAVVRGGAPSCIVFAPTPFSSATRYLVFLAFGSFSHYDEGTYTSKGLTPAQAADLGKRRNPTIQHNDESAWEEVFSNQTGNAPQTGLVQLTELEVRPGYAAAVIASLRSSLVVGVPASVYQLAEGGDTGRLFVMRYVPRFIALDRLTRLDSVSPDAWQHGVSAERVTVLRVRPDLGAFAP